MREQRVILEDDTDIAAIFSEIADILTDFR
jgi:hypothetical protein